MGLSLFIAILAAHGTTCSAETLSLDQYIDQVEEASTAFVASRNRIEGSLKTAAESLLPYQPRLISSANYKDDRTPPYSILMPNETKSETFSVGVEKDFSIGLDAKLSYNLTAIDQLGWTPLLVPSGRLQYTAAYSQLDLSQSLWRNWLGSEVHARSLQSEADSLENYFTERYKLKQGLAQAESAYYHLAVARESVTLQTQVLDRAKKILDWATKRAKSRLADATDMLQAKAAYLNQILELRSASDDEQSAELFFNTVRNSTNKHVDEELTVVSNDLVKNIKMPTRLEETYDVKASEQDERKVYAINEIARQQVQPDLSLMGSIALNGVQPTTSPAVSDSFTGHFPTYSVGLKLTTPLYFWESSYIREGRALQQLAAEAETRQKRFESNQSWIDLQQKFTQARERLDLVDQVVSAQKEKLDHEKTRLSLGRTTTYQVLLFEQDYQVALINQLRIRSEILDFYAQLKSFTE